MNRTRRFALVVAVVLTTYCVVRFLTNLGQEAGWWSGLAATAARGLATAFLVLASACIVVPLVRVRTVRWGFFAAVVFVTLGLARDVAQQAGLLDVAWWSGSTGWALQRLLDDLAIASVCLAFFCGAKALSETRNELAREVSRLQDERQGRSRAESLLHKQAALQRRLETRMLSMQKAESLGVLAAGVAHDFNNLLTAILGYAGSLRPHFSPDSAPFTHINRIETASTRAAELCDSLLVYAGKREMAVEAVDLSEIVREMTVLLEVSVPKKTRFHYELAPRLAPIAVGPAELRQVLLNLLTNASEALLGRDGVITLRTGSFRSGSAAAAGTVRENGLPPGEYVFLEVTDTGVGLDEATARRIFDPFFSTKFPGRGLGLAAVQGLVRNAGGTVTVRSRLHEGTTFRVLFPVRHPAALSDRVSLSPNARAE